MMAMKWLVNKHNVDISEWKIRLITVAVQNVPYYESACFEMKGETLEKAIAMVDSAACRWIYHNNKGDWTKLMEAKENKGFIPI